MKASLSKKRISKRKNPQAAKSEANLNSDARMLECVALGSAGLSPNFDSDDDDDELVYDVLGKKMGYTLHALSIKTEVPKE